MKEKQAVQVTHCINCPITPTLATSLSLMAHNWLRDKECFLGSVIEEEGNPPETLKESYLLIRHLKLALEEEMKGNGKEQKTKTVEHKKGK